MNRKTHHILDTRPIILHATFTLDAIPSQRVDANDTRLILEDYGFHMLIGDLIQYGSEWGDLPGHIHYERILDKLTSLYGVEVDSEYVHDVLNALEYAIYNVACVDMLPYRVLWIRPPLIAWVGDVYLC